MSYFLKLPLILFLLAAPSYGDTMILKSGEELEVDIESFDGTTYKVIHYYSKSIKSRKEIAAADVSEVKKGISKIEEDFASLEQLLPVADGKSESYYEKVILKRIKDFRDEHKSSKYKKKVNKIEEEVLAELEKVQGGFTKVDGKFVSPEELEKTLYDSNANSIKEEVLSAFEEKKYLVGLRSFSVLSDGYQQTKAYQSVLPEVESFLNKFGSTINAKISNPDVGLDEKSIKKLPAAEAERAKNLYMKKRERLEEKMALDMKNKESWITIDTESSSSLKKTRQKIEKTLAEIEKFKSKDFVDGGKIYEELYTAIETEDIESAKELIRDFKKISPADDVWTLMDEKYDALKEKAAQKKKEMKAAERAEKEAARAAKIAEREARKNGKTVESSTE